MRNILVICIEIILLAVVYFFVASRSVNLIGSFENFRNFVASVFFVDSSTEEILRAKYASVKTGEKLKILVISGHDNQYGGAQFRGAKEEDMNAKLGEQLAELLSKDSLFDVTLSRTLSGYNPIFQDYFASQRQQVNVFMKNQMALMDDAVKKGLLQKVVGVSHRNALSEVAYRLYAINKWANDNKIDLVIHIHFNDNPRKNLGVPGIYSGFNIYVPEGQYSNAKGSKAVADSVFAELSKEYKVSNLPKEDEGVVPDQELIAIGSHNSLDSAGMLIEYGYIYESQFSTFEKRTEAISNLALFTYKGVENFFNPAK